MPHRCAQRGRGDTGKGKAPGSIHLVSQLPVTAEGIFPFRDEHISNRSLIPWSFCSPQDLTEQVDTIISEDLKGKRTISVATQTQIKVLIPQWLLEERNTE